MFYRFQLIYQIAKREIKIITSDIDIRTIVLIAPLFYSFFYAAIYLYKSETKVAVAILDSDKSVISKQLTNDMGAHPLLSPDLYLNDFSEIQPLLFSEEIQAVIYIPDGFSRDIKKHQYTTIKIYLNSHRFLHSNDVNKAVNEIVADYNKEIKVEFFNKKGLNSEYASITAEPLKESINYLFNPGQDYGNFIIPAVLILVLQQTLLIGLSESIAKEKEEKSMKELFSTAGNKVSIALFGKTFYYFVIYMSYALLFFTLHFTVFKLNLAGSFILLMGITGLFLLTMIPLSLFIGSLFNRKLIALQIIAFTSYPFFFLSGYAFPSYSMPEGIQYIANILPGTPYFTAFNRLVFMGASFSEISGTIWHLVILWILFSLLAYFRFHIIRRKVNL